MTPDRLRIRNYCIVAHVDHGKSTLADRMLEITGAVEKREFRDQMLDSMDLERERGITIKSHPVTMTYRARDGQDYTFNLIDTPGHVDFNYEVSRSLAACEGAVLLVDAGQGVEAQTVANAYLALEHNLEIIPAINKIDLPAADVPTVCRQIEDLLGLSMEDGARLSAKTGQGVGDLMEAIVRRVPPPAADNPDGLLRALVFDSVYDAYRGVVVYVRVVSGSLRAGDRVRLLRSGCVSEVKEVGIFCPKFKPADSLAAGQVGYVVGTIKDPREVRIGDTLTGRDRPAPEPLPGFKNVQPMVFSGLYPVNSADYEKLRANLGKLSLNDSAFTFQAESSVALGFGFRCGFLGLLHLDVVQERLRREYDTDIISTYPAVVYHVHLRDGTMHVVDNPVNLPDLTRIERIEEPLIKAFVICHNEHIGDLLKLIMDRRGEVEKTDTIDTRRVMLTATLPLNEILVDFYDTLKSISHGYASMDYEHHGYAPADLVKLDILINGEVVDAFSCLIHRDKAEARGRQMCESLKEVIPSHQFQIPIQAAVGKTIIARETIRQFRKDVTAKCYGGDITRKRKLLERQKEGKKRMKQFGKVNIPQEAFVSVLKTTG
jgi:GTP-binding protein LepA